jgi:predicted acyltransferase
MTTTLQPPIAQPRPPAAEPVPGVAAAPAKTRERLLSLDVFRGLTIAGMLLVNNPGDWGSIYPPLEHAAWNGWTPTDLIFPFFLFIAGITTHLSLNARRARGDDEGAIRRQILRRGALIFLFGFLLSGFPFFTWSDVSGIADPTFLQRIVDRLYHWRIMGVLQRIGVAYLVAGLLTQRTTLKQQVMIIVGLLYGYWFAMTLLPVPGTGAMGQLVLGSQGGNLAAWWDRVLLDWSRFGLGNHIWVGGTDPVTGKLVFDPEGFFSTIPAVATAMLGNIAGTWIASRRPLVERLNGLFAAGAIAMMAGLMWHWSFPINKSLWTSSYVLFTAGMACVSLAAIMWIVDVQRVTGWTRFFVIYGMNTIIAFVGSGLMARCIYSIFKVTYGGKRISLQAGIYKTLFLSWLPPVDASLAFAVSFVLFWFCILYVLYRKNIFLKV